MSWLAGASCRWADKMLGRPVVELRNVSKSYKLEGGGRVDALKEVTLHNSSGFYPIRQGEFVMVRARALLGAHAR